MRLEVAFEIVLLVAFAVLYGLAMPYPDRARQFPQLIAAFSLVMVVLALVQDLRRGRIQRKRVAIGRVARAGGIIVGLGFVGGFLLSVLLFFLGFAFFFGARDAFWRHAAIAVGVTAAIWVLFERIMGVPLLEGVLW